MFLTPEQLQKLTGRQKTPSQEKMLKSMGVDYRLRGDGKLVVLASHIEKILNGQPESKTRKPITPDFDNVP